VIVSLPDCPINMQRAHQDGFTLIELLVVTAIVAVLVTLLLTAISGSVNESRKIQCANNVRQLGIALQSFVAENHSYPLLIQPSWIAVLRHEELPGNTNRVPLSQYLNQGIWKCPSAFRPPDYPEHTGYMSYGYNEYGMSARTDTNSLGLGGHFVWTESRLPAPPVKDSEIKNPSQLMAIGDGFEGGNGVIRDGVMALWRTHDTVDYLGSTKRAHTRHQGKANVVFCDGHVEAPTLKFLFADTNDAALSFWNRDHQPHREQLKP
jgi:prepilin-type N-terminal cleavage/methylation domain-containing protein/prepilin-type processing-associated H-X9-DG protein